MTSTSRQIIHLVPGSPILIGEDECIIEKIIDTKSILVKVLETNNSRVVKITDILPLDHAPVKYVDLDTLSDKALAEARKRFEAIEPLLSGGLTVSELKERASLYNVSLSTLYEWGKKYRAVGSLEGLLPYKTGVKKGTKNIRSEVETIIHRHIETIYLTKKRSSIKRLVKKIRRECLEKEIDDVPHESTIRRRLSEISAHEKALRRFGREAAKRTHDPAYKKFPNADFPGAVVQIDNTPANIILVDDENREPVGKPFVCIAIDVFSRIICGYYISFDAPSALSTAMCVTHSVLPKDDWLALHDVKGEWPVWGIMKEIHTDNGSEFRNEALTLGCELNGISLTYRPPGQPQFGGHIERVLKTLNGDISDLDGTTYENIFEKGNYDSEKHSTMTLKEFERWLVHIIVNVYHYEPHSAIDMRPIDKWNEGILGTAKVPGIGLPALPKKWNTFMLDLLPMKKRTVQRTGIQWGERYYSDVLRRWINAFDDEDATKKRKFIVRRDPRDISCVWFYDDESMEYHRIPYADQRTPPMSLAEFNQRQKKRNEARKLSPADELKHLNAYEELDEIRNEASAKTKTLRGRRKRQKVKINQTPITPDDPLKHQRAKQVLQEPSSDDMGFSDDDFESDGDISW